MTRPLEEAISMRRNSHFTPAIAEVLTGTAGQAQATAA
jgi:hypothetical protein